MMKRVIIFTVLLLSLFNNLLMSEELDVPAALLEDVENKTMRPFFNALKNGNVEIIKQYISGEMYEESRILLEENKGYPEYLREHYKGAIFSVKRGVSSDNQLIVDVSVEFPGRGKQISQYILEEPGSESVSRGQSVEEMHWRITGQRNNPDRLIESGGE